MAYKNPETARYYGLDIGKECREINSLADLDNRTIEAIKDNKTTLFAHISGRLVFASTVEDKVNLLSTLKRNDNGYAFAHLFMAWPGKYQTHIFKIKRRVGVVTKMHQILSNAGRAESLHKEFLALSAKAREVRKEYFKALGQKDDTRVLDYDYSEPRTYTNYYLEEDI